MQSIQVNLWLETILALSERLNQDSLFAEDARLQTFAYNLFLGYVFLFTNFPIHFQIDSPAVKMNCM